MFRRSYVQKVQCLEGHSYVQKVLCSESPMFRDISSEGPMFRRPLYSDNPLFRMF